MQCWAVLIFCTDRSLRFTVVLCLRTCWFVPGMSDFPLFMLRLPAYGLYGGLIHSFLRNSVTLAFILVCMAGLGGAYRILLDLTGGPTVLIEVSLTCLVDFVDRGFGLAAAVSPAHVIFALNALRKSTPRMRGSVAVSSNRNVCLFFILPKVI